MSPETTLKEIELGMVKIGCQEKYFKFKTLTPIYATQKSKITDPQYWEIAGWEYESNKKEEVERQDVFQAVLN